MVGGFQQLELRTELKFLAVLEAGSDGVAAGHLFYEAFIQHRALVALFQSDESGSFQAGDVAAGRTGGTAVGAGDGIGLGVHAVVAQHLGQRFQKGALAIGTVAVQKEHTLFSCRAAQAVAHHHLQIFGQLSIPAGDRLDERFPYGGFCQRIVVYLCHAGDVAFPVVGLKFPAGEIKDAVAHIQQTFVFIELVRQHGDARQMLGLFEEGFLAAAGTAFLHMAAHGTGRICVPDAKAGLVHLVQHLIRKALDRSKVIPLPAGAIPYHPALVCGVIAYPVGVAVAEAPGISGVVHGVGLDAGGRRSRGMRSIFCIQSAERFVLIGKGTASCADVGEYTSWQSLTARSSVQRP